MQPKKPSILMRMAHPFEVSRKSTEKSNLVLIIHFTLFLLMSWGGGGRFVSMVILCLL
jgi:hypothetical protein